MSRTCTAPDCGRPHIARGLCTLHYQAAVRANGKFPRPSASDRFWNNVTKTETCWLWTGGYVDRYGYGRFTAAGQSVLAHRWAYEAGVGPIPAGLVIDHLCRVRNCVNPSHLEPVSDEENKRRGQRSPEAETCVNGHPRSELNTYVDPRGKKGCRTCRRNQQAAARARRRSA